MSDFNKGVRQLLAISGTGESKMFAMSGDLQSNEQMTAWFNAEIQKHELPTGYKWYQVDASNPRFDKTAKPTATPVATPTVAVETPVETVADTAKPRGGNKYGNTNEAENQTILAYEREVWARREREKIKKNQAFMAHLAAFKQ